MTQIAKDSGLSREALYKALRPGASPRFDTIARVCKALGVRLVAGCLRLCASCQFWQTQAGAISSSAWLISTSARMPMLLLRRRIMCRVRGRLRASTS